MRGALTRKQAWRRQKYDSANIFKNNEKNEVVRIQKPKLIIHF